MELIIEASKGLLFVSVADLITLSRAFELFQRACDAAVERGLNCILVDASSAHGDITDLERYELGSSVTEYYLARSPATKLAVVGKPPLVNGFGALVASNRGLLARTFLDRQQAIDWLNRFRQDARASQA